MNNVYDEVHFFYSKFPHFDLVVKQQWLEKFLRKKAWAGRSDVDMRSIWQQIKYLYLYLDDIKVYAMSSLLPTDYVKAAVWTSERNPEFPLEEKQITYFFFVLKNFLQYLDTELNTDYMPALYAGMKHFYVNGMFKIPQDELGYDKIYDSLDQADGITPEDATRLNVLLESLLNKIGIYYKSEEFSSDFNRALSLYAGPFTVIPENENDDFWLGFWDYFLFDYHLICNDLSPLQHFYNTNKDFVQQTELRILQDLLKAEFTVFFINYVRDDDMVECTNLFTNEHMQLPQPDYGLYDYRKVLLYGHIYLKGVVMLNYITSVPASKNLRNRIKEEVVRQHQVYRQQEKSASLDDFFKRHAVAVRHTIDILVRLAKVNVVSPNLLMRGFPKIDTHNEQQDEQASVILRSLAARYHFSLYARNMMLKMWQHVCSSLPVAESPETRALSVFLSFTTVNGINFINKKLLLSRFNVNKELFQNDCEKIANALRLRVFDPRYLTEEGFVLSLFAF